MNHIIPSGKSLGDWQRPVLIMRSALRMELQDSEEEYEIGEDAQDT